MSEESEFDFKEWEQASLKKTFHYSFGYLLVFFMGSQFNSYVFYYYEVEIGLPVALLGLAFVIFAVWNMINDPLVGYLTDRPFKWSMKYGFRAPWMVIGVIPYLICWWLLFAAPEALIKLSDPWPIFWYFVIMSCLFDTFYSIFSTHINAGFTTHFRTDAERRRSSAINTTIPQILALFMGFTVPLIYVYGNRDSMVLAQSIVVLLLVFCVLLLIPGIKETEDIKERFQRGYETTERQSYSKTIKAAFKRKNFVSTLIVFALLTLGDILYKASSVYFMKDVLSLPLYNAVFTGLAWFAGFILFIPFWSNLSKRYGHGKIMKLSCILIAIVYLPQLFIVNLFQAIFFSFCGGFVAGAFWVTLGPVQADVYDESTVETGKHQEAMYEGIRTLFYRMTIIGQAIIFVLIHTMTAYNPNPNAVQTDLAVLGIRIHAGLIPSLCAFIAFIVMYKWYDLTGAKQSMLKPRLKELKL
ncbi:MAG: MFS transporter [Promethearchaeota archaeon]|nr:MAG: MFS transporter [Candidatus Lokiarchaeota archaeon]